jgi:hypothetical protein
MSSKRRRFETLLPLQFNDGRDVPASLLGEAVQELFECFGAVSVETRAMEGRWRHEGVIYRDNLSRLIVDVPDTVVNCRWMSRFKSRWKKRLKQLDLWIVTYRIEIQ